MPQATFRGRYYTYGESGENVYDPIYIQQPDDHSCALRSQQIVLRDFGIDIPFEDLEDLAKENNVYNDNGTMTYDVGKVLEICGVGMHQMHGSMKSLISELSQGHRVIVSVDAHELWHNNTPFEKLRNWFKDAIGLQGGNHALIVAGVEVNPLNPNDVKVILTDPGAGHLRIEYPMKQFVDAWNDSGCFMAATDEPAPFQYNAVTGKEEPSGFITEKAYEEFRNQLVAEWGYELKPDKINILPDYHPVIAEHLPIEVFTDSHYSSLNDFFENYWTDTPPSEPPVPEHPEKKPVDPYQPGDGEKVGIGDRQGGGSDETGEHLGGYEDGDENDELENDEN